MKLAPALLVLLVPTLAACPGPSSNPSRLWLAMNGSEVVIKLQDTEPTPW